MLCSTELTKTMIPLGRLDASVSTPYKINHIHLFARHGFKPQNTLFYGKINCFHTHKKRKKFHIPASYSSKSDFYFYKKKKNTTELKDETNIFSMVIIIMQLNLYRAHNVVSVVSPAVQHKDTSPVNMGSGTSTSCLAGDFLTPPASADVAADIAKYTTKVSQIFTHF